MERILAGLNDKQIEAVKVPDGPVLVISGPGSGKTRALTHRIAWLIANGTDPESILAVTFTNKAAGEIRERVHKLLGGKGTKPTVGTFHAVGLRILRREAKKIGYDPNFTILDSADQQTLMKRVLASLEARKELSPGAVLAKVQELKTALTAPEQFKPSNFMESIIARAYAGYQRELKRMNGVDFGDLVMLPVRLFQEHPAVLAHYQKQWHHILVDEYQDTSHDQYTLIRLLASQHRNLFVIGDDAQSIYRFRQADIRNILNFQKDYPEARIVLLEQNYRSTKNILAAAQAVISHNKAQIPKDLWTENDQGRPVEAVECANEQHEARWLVETLQSLGRDRYALSDCAVLYRTHAQSRALEEGLVRAGVPYRIVGGIRFYERREIKDVLAYLRVINNPADSVSFERIVNVPPRGIGRATLAKNGPAVQEFNSLLSDLRAIATQKTVSSLIRDILRETHYERYLAT
ncbi:MAG TPA: UvrD-helicase domain-containing protein, partial [Candidatus Paceibacterota bacterium]|nr:UvrD-helicase domain-containing protein [Candidatus Paceibacterota bacterium]